MPLRRQERAFERLGAPLPVSVLRALFHRSAAAVESLYEALMAHVRSSEHVSADETPQPVLDDDKVRKGWMWVFATDDVILCVFSPSRGGKIPDGVLGRSTGTLTVDGHTGYNVVTAAGRRSRGGCWSHGRYPDRAGWPRGAVGISAGRGGRMAERGAFLRAFLRTPGGIGSVTPSSDALAAMMVRCADIQPGQVVAELGAGTGPVTRALLRAHPYNPLIVLEPDPDLAEHCRKTAPGADVVEAYAQALPALLAERGHERCERVVSSLPFAGWPAAVQDAVFEGILGALAPDGRMVTFTYVHSPWLPAGRRARARLEASFRRVERSEIVWGNFPPAFVYVCDR